VFLGSRRSAFHGTRHSTQPGRAVDPDLEHLEIGCTVCSRRQHVVSTFTVVEMEHVPRENVVCGLSAAIFNLPLMSSRLYTVHAAVLDVISEFLYHTASDSQS